MYYQYKYGIQGKDGQVKEEISEPLFEMACTISTKYSKVGNRPKANCTNIRPEDLLGLGELDKGRHRSIQQFGNDLDEADFDAGNPKGIKGIFFYPVDEVTKQPTGAPAIASLKIDTYGKSKFRYPSGKNEDGTLQYTEVPWEEIMNKNIEGLVVFCLRDEYKASDKRPLIQAFVRSCIIYSISDKGEVDPTKSTTAQAYLADRPDVLSDLATQMEAHRARANQSLLTGGEKMVSGTEVQNQAGGQMANQMPGQSMMAPGQQQPISMSQMAAQMGQMMAQNPGQMMSQMPGQMPGQMMSQNPGQMTGQMMSQNSGQMTGQMPMQSGPFTGQSGGFALPGGGPNYGQADLTSYLQTGGATHQL